MKGVDIMQCVKCGTAENVNFEGMCKKCYEETLGINKKETEKTTKKSDFLLITQSIIIAIVIIGGLIEIISKSYILLAVTIISAIVICITLSVFKIIIDLLQSIDEKL